VAQRRDLIRGQSKKKKKWPARPPRPGAPLTAFDLGRDNRLAPVRVMDTGHYKGGAEKLAAIRAERARHVIELAWDGHRVLACMVGDHVRLVSSDFREWADLFPTVVRALQRLKRKDLVLEGWICALGDTGLPSWDLLRLHAQKQPQRVVFACSDLLRVDGEDLRSLPLTGRRERLVELLATVKEEALASSESLVGSFDAVLEGVRMIGARGIMVREADEAYPIERSDDATWLVIGAKPDEDIEIDRMLSPPPKVTNQDKLMYPRDGLSKKDVVAYYDDIAPIMLEYMKDRPIVGQRWPDGIDDFTWYQHRMPPKAPDYLRAVWIEGNRRIVVENRDALCWLANQAVLTFHAWASRCSSLAHPDWVVIDLDPGEKTTWPQVIEVAIGLRKLLELLELPSIPKTSGQKGIHVLIPIGPGHNVIQAHELARRAAKMLCKVLPNLVTMESSIADRHGRLFLDTLQNFMGKTLVVPYSLRAADGAPVSTPLLWSEVTPKLDPRQHTMKSLRKRIDTMGDICKTLLSGTAKLPEVIGKMEP
jgi:DNA ligase D-like protein (predicted polymerase)